MRRFEETTTTIIGDCISMTGVDSSTRKAKRLIPNMVPWDGQIKSSEDISAVMRRPYTHFSTSGPWLIHICRRLEYKNFYIMLNV